MKIAVYHGAADSYCAEIVATALIRSFTSDQVRSATYQQLAECASGAPMAVALINPPASAVAPLAKLLASGGKALLLGRVPEPLADLLGLGLCDREPLTASLGIARVDHAQRWNESPAKVLYTDHKLARLAPLAERALERFDFQNEWNNLGYGRIQLDGGPWSLTHGVTAQAIVPNGATPIAWVSSAAEPAAIEQAESLRHTLYAALRDSAGGAALWFNRSVGPVDSCEWRIVEGFFGDYRPDELICLPYLSEIPAGYAAAMTMRLDCDEAIHSARPLYELYQDLRTPFSLAILTGQNVDSEDLRLLDDVVAGGGSVVAHSVTHRPNWGGSYAAAFEEARDSKAWLERHAPAAAPVEHAVSPFHQNPQYAVAALGEAGYAGFIGGIIANDPEYLLGRAGQTPFVRRPFVSLSAQSMLHGDCHARAGGSIEVHHQSFENHRRAGSIFGYLDHPFSPRYQYGWPDEATRLGAHQSLLQSIGEVENVWRASLNDSLIFLRRRNSAGLSCAASDRAPSWRSDACPSNAPSLRMAAHWKGQIYGE